MRGLRRARKPRARADGRLHATGARSNMSLRSNASFTEALLARIIRAAIGSRRLREVIPPTLAEPQPVRREKVDLPVQRSLLGRLVRDLDLDPAQLVMDGSGDWTIDGRSGTAAQIAAERIVEYLERSRFVVMKRPPAAGRRAALRADGLPAAAGPFSLPICGETRAFRAEGLAV